MLRPLVISFREGIAYRAKGNLLWLLHRISGLGIVVFLGFHIFGMSMAAFNPALHERALELYKTPPLAVGELILAFLLIFHAVNGTRIAILELRPQLWEKHEVATRLSLIITAALALPTLGIMAYKSISHFLGH
ncbi:MAG: hypothetical protein N2545_04375 [Thermoflexales bacterium]|nr:hypothetical protein [Thermoflexales bacterium]